MIMEIRFRRVALGDSLEDFKYTEKEILTMEVPDIFWTDEMVRDLVASELALPTGVIQDISWRTRPSGGL